MNRAILPARRLRLRARYHLKTLLAMLVCLAMAAALALCASWFASSTGTIMRDNRIWDRGVPAADGWIDGERQSKTGLSWFIAIYDAKVRYSDDRGDRFEGNISFVTMFGGPGSTETAELRYDPDHHERFAVSWGVEASGARWRAAIVLTLLPGLFALLFVWLVVDLIKDIRRAQRIAATGDELEVRVLSYHRIAKNGQATDKWSYQLELDDGTTRSQTLPWLLFVGGDDSRALALWQPGDRDHLIFVQHDGAPFALINTERAELARRAEAARG